MTTTVVRRIALFSVIGAFVTVSQAAFRQVWLTASDALVPPRRPPAEPLQFVTDLDAYAIYGVVIPSAWATVSTEMLLLQQETEGIEALSPCFTSVWATDAEWNVVEASFKQENERARALQPMLPIGIPYRLAPHVEILADDARLALKYPGIWQRRPESMEYAAVSAVGFNPAKTKAMVYVRLRSSGGIRTLELRDGNWVSARLSRGCGGWIA
jgi:hypothetical protein